MDELLKEVTLSDRRKQKIDTFIQTVTELLETVPHSPEVEVCVTLTFGYRGIILFMELLSSSPLMCSGE